MAEGKTPHQATRYQLGIGVADRQAALNAYHQSQGLGAQIEKNQCTPPGKAAAAHAMAKDPDVNLIETDARPTDTERADKPADALPIFLVQGSGPQSVNPA